jgi:hypothetical protein
MNRDPSAQRDAHLLLVRRLRIGLVAAGVAGSLGLAGLVAAGSPIATSGASTPRPAAPVQGDSSGPSGGDFSGWQDDGGDDAGVGDDGGQSQNQPQRQQQNQQQNQPQAPGLQPGSGHSHGSTSGS